MTTTKTLLLLRQTLARARVQVEECSHYASGPDLSHRNSMCLTLLPDIEQAIIEADREIERLEGGGINAATTAVDSSKGTTRPASAK